jgi:hypothetical protein
MGSRIQVIVASMQIMSLHVGIDPLTVPSRVRNFMAHVMSLAGAALELTASDLDYDICARNSDLRVNLVLRPKEQRVLAYAHVDMAACASRAELLRAIEQDAGVVHQALARMQLHVSLSSARMQIKHDAVAPLVSDIASACDRVVLAWAGRSLRVEMEEGAHLVSIPGFEREMYEDRVRVVTGTISSVSRSRFEMSSVVEVDPSDHASRWPLPRGRLVVDRREAAVPARSAVLTASMDSGAHLIMEVRATRCAITGRCIRSRLVRILESPQVG